MSKNGRHEYYSANTITASIITDTGLGLFESLYLGGGVTIATGTLDPEGFIDGQIGDMFIRTNSTEDKSNQLSIKTTAGGNTGWQRNVQMKKGTTAQRPTALSAFSDTGLQYFDTDLLIPIYFVATNSTTGWSNAAGADV